MFKKSLFILILGLSLLMMLTTSVQVLAKSNQELNLSTIGPLETIDISKSTGFGQTGNVFESFYRLGKNGKVSEGLAKSSMVSKDGKTWTFVLRDSKWSNGDKITANDFVYSWKRTLNPKTASPYAYLFYGIKNAKEVNQGKVSPNELGIVAKDAKTVEITLNKPLDYFKVLMAYPLFGPQNEKIIKKYGNKYGLDSDKMVYSGPFKIKNWNLTSDKWSFVKNNNYWDSSVVKLDKINYKVVKDTNTGHELYQQNKLDLTQLSNQQVKVYKNNKEFKQYPYSLIVYLTYNFEDKDLNKKAALKNKNIRLAMSLALDRKRLTKKVFGDGSDVPTGFVARKLANDPKTGEDFAKEQAVKDTVDYNEKLARKYWNKGLKQLGVKKLHFNLLAGTDSSNNNTLTQYLQSQYAKVLPGLSINIEIAPGKNAVDRAQKGDFDLYISHWGGDFNDPITFLEIPLASTPHNYGKYFNKEYDNLIEKAVNEDSNDKYKRWEDLVKAAKIFNADQGVTPLYQQVTPFLQKEKVKGIIHNTAGTQWNYKYTYIE